MMFVCFKKWRMYAPREHVNSLGKMDERMIIKLSMDLGDECVTCLQVPQVPFFECLHGLRFN